jgi:hypothetical protein
MPILTVGGLATFNNNIALAGADRTIINTSDNALSLGTNNLTRLTILNDGNVGIGNTSPDRALIVQRSGENTVAVVQRATSSQSAIFLAAEASLATLYSRFSSTNGSSIPFRIVIGANEALRVTSDRLVGIETTTPSAQLQVRSNATTRVPLIVDTLASHTANLQQWRLNTSVVAGITASGAFSGSHLQGLGSINNSAFTPTDNGATISRNIADANPSLIVNQQNSSSTGDILRLQKAGSSLGVFTHEGRLGIGTTTPATRLEVYNDNNTTPLRVSVGTNANYDFSANSTSSYTTTFNMTNTGFSIGHASAIRDFRIQTNSTPRITVLGDGKVGVGTTAPARLLSLLTGGNDDGVQIRRPGTATGNFVSYGFRFATTDNAENNAEVRGTRTNRAVGGDTDLSFHTYSNSVLGERMRIRDDGNVGIGTTSPGAKLEVNGNQKIKLQLFIDNSTNAGENAIVLDSGGSTEPFYVEADGDVYNQNGTYGTSSDVRIKENIVNARNYTKDLMKLRVVKYSLKEEKAKKSTHLGFIAQEFEQVFPNMVSTGKHGNINDFKSIKTSVLIPMLVKTIQELNGELNAIKSKLGMPTETIEQVEPVLETNEPVVQPTPEPVKETFEPITNFEYDENE